MRSLIHKAVERLRAKPIPCNEEMYDRLKKSFIIKPNV